VRKWLIRQYLDLKLSNLALSAMKPIPAIGKVRRYRLHGYKYAAWSATGIIIQPTTFSSLPWLRAPVNARR